MQVTHLARYLAKCGLEVSQLMQSGKLRAQQTAEILAAALGIKTVTEFPVLQDTESGVHNLLEMLESWDDDTMLVGHLPFLPQLINALLLNNADYPPIIHYPPATIVCLERHDDLQWVIRWVLNPDMIPAT